MIQYLPTVLLALCTGAVQAQDWQHLGPDGGVVRILEAPDPESDRTYALGDGGLLRSDDRGLTWQLVRAPFDQNPSETFVSAAFSPNNKDAVVLARTTGAWRSADGGHSWQQLALNTSTEQSIRRITAIAVDPDDAERIVVFMVMIEHGEYPFTYSARWHSEDGGQSGELQPTPQNYANYCGGLVRDAYDHVNAAAFHEGDLYYSHFHACQSTPRWPSPHIRHWGSGMDYELDLYYPPSPNSTVAGALKVLDDKVFVSQFHGPLQRIDLGSGNRDIVRNAASTVKVTAEGSLIVGSGDGLHLSADLGDSWQPASGSSAMLWGPAALFTSPTRWLTGGLGVCFLLSRGVDPGVNPVAGSRCGPHVHSPSTPAMRIASGPRR